VSLRKVVRPLRRAVQLDNPNPKLERGGSSYRLLPRSRFGLGFAFLVLLYSFSVGDEISEDPITDLDRDHWSFKPLSKPELPSPTKHAARNAIDLFINAALNKAELKPVGEAKRTTLLRRLKFDLLGLPPTPAEIESFLRDDSDSAYEKLVDRFLASPRYGERWAQHWLDLARFAETDGFEHDKVRPNAWKYRDWVIDTLNADMPYDRFLQLQIAGDELEPESESAKIATAFCLSGPDMPDINSQDERRHNLLNELTSTVGSVVLGLQIGCAQCHDHKYDPISQADFYRMRAFFDSAVQVKRNDSIFTLATSTKPIETHVWLRGDHRSPGAKIDAGFLRVVDSKQAGEPAEGPRTRLELARWLTESDHPLTSRVIVNRVWQYHFGQGLSSTSSDFGVMGYEPTHPELLDWLATEFVRNGWRLKWLHQQIVISAAYKRAGYPVDDSEQELFTVAKKKDPDNELLARFSRRRLSGETLRDAMLAITETLNTEPGGPGVRPPLPREIVSTLLRKQWETTPYESQHQRRSVYVFARRNLRYPIFDVFDRPDGNASCNCRDESTTATQSLLMLNSEPSLAAAKLLADLCLRKSDGNFEDAVALAILKCFGRKLRKTEREFFQTSDSENPRDALTHICLGLLNANEFFYID